ncbi:phospholipase/Carboxylesterase [Hirsutella rhossiliensis]|uniref:Acyl-protein thioesterase 1 n=1 Tax=Hirsutella rhossiliensis TaxID=111463 RepID=A0A9P8N600_9HYPO|nr:phospholipase/Carboxylesterase domain-containing protein [Hirsutella rhossiliensis]KAH0967560.1 phospholipase/Carboxylesterase domain-containing protein [Hirsutella rhossiliensis]
MLLGSFRGLALLTPIAAALAQDNQHHRYEGLQVGLGEPGLTIHGIPFSTRAHWMRQANEALYHVARTPCPFEAFGTVIVNHTAGGLGDLVCIGANMRSSTGDPTMHGEIAAIRNCSAILTDPTGPYRLTAREALAAFSQLTLYTNAESCPMCASAIYWAGMREYVYGTGIEAMVRKGWGQVRMSSPEVLRQAFNVGGGPTRILGGVLANETDAYLLWQFDPDLVIPVIGLILSLLSQRHLSSPASGNTATTPASDNKLTSATMSSSIRRTAPLVFPAVGKHTATVFFAHGLGDSGAGWADAVQHWRRKRRLDEVKFVLPNAPVMPITLNNGFPMPAWFDIKSLAPSINSLQARALNEDVAGILESRAYFHSLIQDEISAGIPAHRIVLGGFSQGGASSILAGLTAPVQIGGVVALSSWLLLSQSFKEHVPEGDFNKATPVFMAHGDRDQMVRYDLAKASAEALKNMGYDVTLKTYPGMEHSACAEELDEVEAFLKERLPSQGQ